MTLYRQLILIIIVLFAVCFLASVTVSISNLRNFLGEQLASHAQDTATSLGLSLSSPMQRNDLPVMNSMVDAIFDRGYYKTISVITIDGDTLIERSNPVTGKNVPAWFVNNVDLRLPTTEAMVMSGWKQAATVVVVSNPGSAYRELWKNTVDTFWLFSLTTITALLLGIMAIRLLLKPLQRVEEQAKAICERTYVIQERLPRTRELRRVVKAMNRLTRKVNEIFTEQTTLTERLREQAYKDPVTDLGNRRYFDRQLRTLIESHEESAGGAVILVEIYHLEHINTASGYQAGDRVLHRSAELIQTRLADFRNCFASRISGAGFAIVANDFNNSEADALANSLSHDLLKLHSENLVEFKDIANIGVAMWQSGDNLSDVLAKVDIALRSAQTIGGNAWYRYEPPANGKPSIRGAAQWYAFLKQVIGSTSVALFAQPVLKFTSTGLEVVHKEIFLRLPGEDGELIMAGVFMPMAERMGLATALDKLTISKLLEYLSANAEEHYLYTLNLTSTSLHDPMFVEWLCNQIQAAPDTGRRIVFELPEFGVLRNIENTRTFVDRLSALGCGCGIDHFGRGFNSFGYLSSIKVQYLKIDAGYTRDINRDAENQFFIRALADTAHSIDISVFAAAVETREESDAVRSLKVDGIQGYLVGKPESL